MAPGSLIALRAHNRNTSGVDPLPQAGMVEDRRGAVRALAACVWRGVRSNKALIAAVVLTASLEAFFTKAPFVLVKPLFDTIASPADSGPLIGPPVPPAESHAMSWSQIGHDFGRTFMVWFVELSNAIRDGLGVQFTGDAHAIQSKSIVLTCALLAALLGLLGGVAIYFASLLSRYFASKIVVDLRNEVAAHILKLPLRFFGRRRMGELISRLTNDTTVLARSFTLVSDYLLVDPIMIVLNVAMVAAFAPEVLPFFLPAIPLMALPMIRLGRKVHRRSRGSLEAMGDATESMNQMLSGIKTVKAFQLEDVRLREFEESNRNFLHRTRRMLQAKGRSQGIVFVGYQVAFAAITVTLGWLLINGYKTPGDIAVILVPISTTYQHVKRIARVYNTVMESAGAMEGVQSILEEAEDLTSRPGGRPVARIQGRVDVEDVWFAYEDEQVLQGLEFHVDAGTMVALVGPSGAGKSTCIDLIARFHDPQRGRILIDGQDLRELDLASYRRQIAMVGQQPFLFNTTIGENIRYGRPGAKQSEIEAAAAAAQIHDFILSLPHGYDTVVGERGSNISGGQMQRVTIARAILRDPRILVLDEATSALDSESEDAVQRALKNLMKGRTSIVIAHRLSTIRDADQIVVFEAGQVVESGRHEELVARSGVYSRLIELQNLG